MSDRPGTEIYPTCWSDGQKRLASAILSLLSNNLGAFPFPLSRTDNWPVRSPFLYGFMASLAYICVFCGFQYIIGKPDPVLLLLSFWGGCYLGFAVAIARLTSESVQRTITRYVIANLHDSTADAIADEFQARFKNGRINLISLCISAVVAFASAIALAHDLGFKETARRSFTSPEIVELVIWAVGFFFLYVLAARATNVARFYGVFAEQLKSQPNSIFALDPAHSVLIAEIASIGRRILFFWFGIALSIATLIPLFRHLTSFILVVVPITMFFSIAFGTIVFLTAEHAIRRVVRDKSSSTLADLEEEISRLFDQREILTAAQWEEFALLKQMHKELSSAGGYRGYLPSILSLIPPLLGPAVAAVALYVEPSS